jgi:hypothetical protein
MIYLQNVTIWIAWKLSGKTQEQFSFIFNLAWYFPYIPKNAGSLTLVATPCSRDKYDVAYPYYNINLADGQIATPRQAMLSLIGK